MEIRGDVTMRDEQTTEDRATQPMEAGGWVSQFWELLKKLVLWINTWFMKTDSDSQQM